jgi:hypothetical protein
MTSANDRQWCKMKMNIHGQEAVMARDAKSDKLKGEFAFIPGRWVERNISDMELDEPYILSVMHCEAPGCESSRLWVDQNGAPMLAGDMDASDLGRDMNAGDLMAGGFAVMRTWAMVGGEPKEGYVVDIRYSDTGMIPRIDTTKVPDDQEEYDGWLDFMQHTIPVAAVVIAKAETLANELSNHVVYSYETTGKVDESEIKISLQKI